MKCQSFGHLLQRADSLEKTLTLGKIEGRKRRGQQRMGWLDGIPDSMDVSLSELWEMVKDGSLECCIPWGCKELGRTEQLNSNVKGPSFPFTVVLMEEGIRPPR